MSSTGGMYRTALGLFAAVCVIASAPASAQPVGTSFTYQGHLEDGAVPAGGTFDFEFRLFDAPAAGLQQGPVVAVNDLAVTDGLFTTTLDFGPQAFGDALWLQVAVRPGAGTGAHTVLSPRQPLTSTMYSQGLVLPLLQERGGASTTPLFQLNHTGTGGHVARFRALNADQFSTALHALSAGGNAFQAQADGSFGRAATFLTTGATNPNPTVEIQNSSTAAGAVALQLVGDLFAIGDNSSIRFPATSALSPAAMIEMFASGISNSDRMVIAHSPGVFSNWGLQYQDSADRFNFLANGSPVLTVVLGGSSVGVLTSTPAFNLHVNGTAGKPGGGSWAVASDERLKTNIRDLKGSLDRLLALRGVTFEFKDPAVINELPGVQTGMIAQEVERVFPEWIAERPDGYKSLSTCGFEALTVEALRELRAEKDAQVDRLNGEVDALKAENAELRARLDALEAAVAGAAAGTK